MTGRIPHGPGFGVGLLPGRSYEVGDDAASGLPKRITRINPTIMVTSAHAAARPVAFITAENCKRVSVFISVILVASAAPLYSSVDAP